MYACMCIYNAGELPSYLTGQIKSLCLARAPTLPYQFYTRARACIPTSTLCALPAAAQTRTAERRRKCARISGRQFFPSPSWPCTHDACTNVNKTTFLINFDKNHVLLVCTLVQSMEIYSMYVRTHFVHSIRIRIV